MAFGFYRSITIDHTKVGSTDQTDFPVLVSGTYSYLALLANGGKVQNASGYDVGFYADSALTSKLKWEREAWNAVTGAVIFHVKVPTVAHSADSVIYMAYGDAGISTDQSDGPNTWNSGFQAVYHLPNGVTLTVADATANANNGTNSGATAAAGQIDGAANLLAVATAYVDLGSNAALETSKPVTVSAWVNVSNSVNGKTIWGPTATTGPLQFGTSGGGTPTLFFNKSNLVNIGNSTGTITSGTWAHVGVSYDGSGNYAFYINGAVSGTGTNNQTFATSGNASLGRNGGNAEYMDGTVDEVRFSTVVRAADWFLSEYNNAFSPATFYTVGSEQTPGGVTISPYYYLRRRQYRMAA